MGEDALVPVVRPADLVLRCYTRPDPERPGRWLACCVDLNLWAAAADSRAAMASLSEAIRGYLETALEDSEPRQWVRLLHRPAPLADRLYYAWLRLLDHLNGKLASGWGHPYVDAPRLQVVPHS